MILQHWAQTKLNLIIILKIDSFVCWLKDTGEVVIEELVVRGRHWLEEVLSVGFKPGRGC